MKYLKIKNKFINFSLIFDIICDQDVFTCKSRMDTGFEIIDNNEVIIEAVPEKTNGCKKIKVVLVKNRTEICTIFPKLVLKENEYFFYNGNDYNIPNFWKNDLPQLRIYFSKWALSGFPYWGAKGYFAKLDDNADFNLAISLLAYIQIGLNTD